MKILIKNGHLIDSQNKLNGIADLLLENGKVSQIAEHIQAQSDKVIDASGKIVMPGIVDMHVHLREPGREDEETVLTGTLAASHRSNFILGQVIQIGKILDIASFAKTRYDSFADTINFQSLDIV